MWRDFVHHLREQHVARFEEVGRGVGDPARGHVAGNEFDFVEERAEQTLGFFDGVGQRFDRVPRHVGGGTPLTLQRFFVQERRVRQPDLRFRAYAIRADTIGIGPFAGAARTTAHVLADFGDFAVAADLNFGERQAALARFGVHAPLAHVLHPARVEIVFVLLDRCLAHVPLAMTFETQMSRIALSGRHLNTYSRGCDRVNFRRFACRRT